MIVPILLKSSLMVFQIRFLHQFLSIVFITLTSWLTLVSCLCCLGHYVLHLLSPSHGLKAWDDYKHLKSGERASSRPPVFPVTPLEPTLCLVHLPLDQIMRNDEPAARHGSDNMPPGHYCCTWLGRRVRASKVRSGGAAFCSFHAFCHLPGQ